MNNIITYIKTNYKDFLSLIFFIVCYIFSIFLFLGGVNDPSLPTDLDSTPFLILSGINILLFAIFIFIEVRYFKMKINIPLIIVLVSLFIINLVNTLIIPLENTVGFEYYPWQPSDSVTVIINNEYKIEYIICFLLLLLNVYISFNYLISRLQFRKGFSWLCCIIIITVLVFVVYSYATEGETYKLFIENINKKLVGFNPTSFTNHRNSYAAIILGGAFCSYAMYIITKKKLPLILGLFFCANTIFPMSRLCLLLSFTLSLLVFAYMMVVSWKAHTFRNLNLIFLLIFGVSLLIIIACNDETMKEYIKHILLTDNISNNTRYLLRKCVLSMMNGSRVFIGFGHGYFNTVFALANGEHVKMPHNLYLQTYGALGIVGLVCFGSLILFAIYKNIKLFKTNKDAAYISAIGLIIVLIYYVFEG